MSLLNNHTKNDKKGGKSPGKSALQPKTNAKPAKGAGFSKKPVKTGGTRGS